MPGNNLFGQEMSVLFPECAKVSIFQISYYIHNSVDDLRPLFIVQFMQVSRSSSARNSRFHLISDYIYTHRETQKS